MMLVVSLVFALLLFQFHSIQFWMGVIFVLSLLIFIYIIIRSSRKKGIQTLQEDDLLEEVKSFPVWKSTTYLLLGGIALYYGADLLINGAVSIAKEWGVSERVISISLVAIELVFLNWLHH